MKLFDNGNAEKCFRHWQSKHAAKLAELWANYQKMGFDVFCREVYTGRIKTNLQKELGL